MKKLFVACIAAAAFCGAPALAADMAVKAPPPPPVAAPYNWGGFYIGGNAGYGWGSNSDPSSSFVDNNGIGMAAYFAGGNPVPNVSPKGALGGVQIGYNWLATPN